MADHGDIDHTGLTGVGGGTPDAHAASHENGGSDEIDVTGLAGAGGGSLSYQQAQLAANVTMTNANQDYDGPAVTLSAGTWFIIAGIFFTRGAAAYAMRAKIWDGTTVISSTQADQDAGFYNFLSLFGVVVIAAGTPTWKVSANCGGAGAVMHAATNQAAAGNTACTITAIKIA